jgi:hypothetical protein
MRCAAGELVNAVVISNVCDDVYVGVGNTAKLERFKANYHGDDSKVHATHLMYGDVEAFKLTVCLGIVELKVMPSESAEFTPLFG